MATQDQSLDDSPLLDGKWMPPGRMSEDEFVAWCDEDTRAEWIDGEVLIMNPPNFDHADLSAWLVAVIRPFVEQRDLGKIVQDFHVRLPRQRRRRTPDLCFVAKERLGIIRRNHVEGAPDLIIEIVSPDSEARDWREKYLEYQAAGVKEYWVIDPLSQQVEIYGLTGPQGAATGEYRRVGPAGGVIESSVLAGLCLQVPWLWLETRPKLLDALRQLGLL